MSHDQSNAGVVNRLGQETSPYLKQHAHNPVEWYPWGEEALARSRTENKPIFLSIGYSACHWCHVMAHESFEDPEVARVLNEHFISIKVDREERPDIDQLYQGVVVLMGRGGGWPLTVFLTPQLQPFFAGTYFPKEDRYGVPGFKRLLETLEEMWRTKRDEVDAQAQQFEQGLMHLSTYGLDGAPTKLSVREVISAAQRLEREVDRTHGGFGGAPKFPNPMNVALLLRGHRRNGTMPLKSAAMLCLEKMALGGIYDQLGGGFHRYSVDNKWLVPHFEKMLYDNALLLHLYAEAFQVEPKPLFKKVVEETAEYIHREMTHASGGFYSAQDADSEGEEGKFFVWTPQQMDAVLSPEEAAVAKAHFGVTEEGNFEHGRSVLEVNAAVAPEAEPTLEAARRKLFEAREQRVRPGLDDKILAGWNGLMIRGLAFASRVFGKPEWARWATAAADFLWSTLWDGQQLLRVYAGGAGKIHGLLEDYGDLAAGLTALFQATGEARHLEAAKALVQRAMEIFWDDTKNAYLSGPKEQADLLCANYALHDNAYPSGASTLTEAQVALAALTGDRALLEHAELYLFRMGDEMSRNPFAYGHLWLAADNLLDGAGEIVLVGERDALEPLWTALHSTYAPTLAVLRVPSSAAAPSIVKETVEGKELLGGQPAAYLCRRFTCEAPVTDPLELRVRLLRMAAAAVVSF